MEGGRGPEGVALRESSRPKACTVRIILPKLFTATPGLRDPELTLYLGCHKYR